MNNWLERAKEEISKSSKDSSIYIGTDSDKFKKRKKWYIKYSTVIIIHKDTKHGGMIFHNTVVEEQFYNMSLKEKLMKEVQFAISAATEVVDVVGDRHWEIHLDLNTNPKHKSNVAEKEALGYVRGMFDGKEAKVKPHSWAASHAGDRVARGKIIHDINRSSILS